MVQTVVDYLLGYLPYFPFFPCAVLVTDPTEPCVSYRTICDVFEKIECMFYATGLCLSSSLSTFLSLSIYEILVLVYNLESK